jgi:hypothetical protein
MLLCRPPPSYSINESCFIYFLFRVPWFVSIFCPAHTYTHKKRRVSNNKRTLNEKWIWFVLFAFQVHQKFSVSDQVERCSMGYATHIFSAKLFLEILIRFFCVFLQHPPFVRVIHSLRINEFNFFAKDTDVRPAVSGPAKNRGLLDECIINQLLSPSKLF